MQDWIHKKVQNLYLRRKQQYIIFVITAVILFFAVCYILKSSALTASREPDCGLTEHAHTEECYDEEKELICGLKEHTHTDSCYSDSEESTTSKKVLKSVTEKLSGKKEESESGLDLGQDEYKDYIKSVQLLYLKDNKWTVPEDNVLITAPLRLSVSYERIPAELLLENDCRMILPLPNVLMGDEVTSDLTESGGEKIGTIEVQEECAILTFNQEWLEEQRDKNKTVQGNFYIYATGNWPYAEDPDVTDIQIGNHTIQIQFEQDLAAKYGDISIKKAVSQTVIEEDGREYLEYTVTVKVPEDLPVDVMPDISVTDQITESQEYVEKYICTDEDTYIEGSNPGTLHWKIGDMKKGEEKTLKYRVLLKESYTGGISKGTISNKAVVSSKTYERDEADADFTPKADLDVSKKSGTYNSADSTITYTIKLTAKTDNSYPLEDVCIKDLFDTDYPDYITYLTDSFRLNEKELTEENALTIDKDNAGFTLNTGTIPAGESCTLTYQVKVSPEMMASSNEAVILTNQVKALTGEGDSYGKAESTTSIGRKVWDRKMVSDPIPEDTVISMDSKEVYSDMNTKENPATDSFTVPKGSFQYGVIVNEAGDWDLSGATFRDMLQQKYLSFTGYVRVDAYDIEEGVITPDMTDEEAASLLKNPVRTAWMKIGSEEDGSFQFSLIPQKLGFESGKNQAYRLTYYAVPYGDLDSISQTSVTNEFELYGNASIGSGEGGSVVIPTIKTSVSAVVQGGVDFTAKKSGWYYARNATWPRGELYWVIKVDGTIKRGAQVIDSISANGQNTNQYHNIWVDSCIGVYRGSLTGKTLSNGNAITDVTECPDFDYFESLGMTKLTKSNEYSTAHNSRSQMTITFNEDIKLGVDESIYIIMKTEPGITMQQTSAEVFQNGVSISSPGGMPVFQNTATLAGYGHDMLYKTTMGIYTYDANKQEWITDSTSYNRANGYVDKTLISESGTYVDWSVRINWFASLSGKHELTEQIPEGLEVAYVRIFGVAGHYLEGSSNMPVTPVIDSLEGNDNWEKKTVTSSVFGMNGTNTYNSGLSAQCTYYYNQNTNQIRLDLDNLYKISDYTKPSDFWGKGNVELQILCRVTDPDLLLSGTQYEQTVDKNDNVSISSKQQSETYTNTAKLTDQDGKSSEASAPVTFSKSTIDKTMTQNQNNNSFLYSIEVNQLGEDLIKNKDTVTLIDEMEDPLVLDAESITVYQGDKNSTKELSKEEWSFSIEKKGTTQYIKLVLPDSKALTVKYNTSVNAAPLKAVTISNKAYWEGYSSNASVYKGQVMYRTVGGTATGTEHAYLKLNKRDSSGGQLLGGAVYQLQSGTMTDHVFQADDSDAMILNTSEKGAISSEILQWDTVYELTELSAPEGYVTDGTPHYFLMAKNIGTDDDPQFYDYSSLEDITVCYSATYQYTAYNSRPKIEFTKKFLDKNGEVCDPIPGTYRFGLYNVPKPTASSKPVQTLEVTYRSGEPSPFDSLVFENLEEGSYTIFEIDDDGKPITGTGVSAQVGGNQFFVSSTGNVNLKVSNKNVSGAEITNRLNQFSLPETGEIGGDVYRILGVVFIFCAAISCILYNSRKGKYYEQDKKIF